MQKIFITFLAFIISINNLLKMKWIRCTSSDVKYFNNITLILSHVSGIYKFGYLIAILLLDIFVLYLDSLKQTGNTPRDKRPLIPSKRNLITSLSKW